MLLSLSFKFVKLYLVPQFLSSMCTFLYGDTNDNRIEQPQVCCHISLHFSLICRFTSIVSIMRFVLLSSCVWSVPLRWLLSNLEGWVGVLSGCPALGIISLITPSRVRRSAQSLLTSLSSPFMSSTVEALSAPEDSTYVSQVTSRSERCSALLPA